MLVLIQLFPYFFRVAQQHSNSRNQSPLPLTNQQDASALGGIISAQPPSKPSSTSSGAQDDQVTSPVQYLETSNVSGMDNSSVNYDHTNVADHQQMSAGMVPSTEAMVAAQQQQQGLGGQQPQHFVFGQHAQQQAMGMPSPYFVANTAGGQDPYGQNGGISIVNANGQTAVIHPQYAAAYGIQPYVYANQSGNAYMQQQPQQIPQQQSQQGVRTPTTSTTSTAQVTQQQLQGQQIPPGYQVVQGPLNFPTGSTFYDQHGNPVIINGRMTAPMTNLGQPVRVVPPMVLNSGPPTVSPGIHSGTSPSMQMYGQQQAGQQQQQQQRPGRILS